jgi:hypothetical protein
MTQHYDIMSVNVVMLIASGYGYILTGHEPTGFFLLFLSLCNVIGIVVGRITELENYRKQQESDMLDNDYEYDEDEEEEENLQEEPEVEEEEEEPDHVDEAEVEDEQPTEESDVHYCGSEACGEEITNLEGAGLCAGCGLVYYCNTDCQKLDWKAGHKLICDKNTSISDDSSSESVGDTVPEPKLVEEPVPEPVVVTEVVPVAVTEVVPEPVAEPEPVEEPAPAPAPAPVPEAVPEPPKLPVYPVKFRPPPPPPPPPSGSSKTLGFIV